jgi:hypothetical protein
MKRESSPTNALFGSFRRFYVPTWVWLAGYFATLITVVGAIVWINLVTVEGSAL